jgi:hypothetical protein
MRDSGKTLLKVISILFIVFGAIATIFSIIGLISLSGTILVIATIILLIGSLIELVIGIIGYKKSSDPSDANFFMVTGFALGIIMLISMVMGFSAWSLIGFALPVLYIIGGYMIKRAPA